MFIRTWLARLLTHAVVLSLLAQGFTLAGGLAFENMPKQLTEEQKIRHVLDRLGFGARPGDIERVRSVGLGKYIEQQLDPAAIDDRHAEQRTAGLEVFKLSTSEVFGKYPSPAAIMAMLDGGRNAVQTPAGQNPDEAMTEKERRERQQKIAELYRKNDLRRANTIMPQVTANRILRAVYSERQLQEVMVDFWQNHFNVFAGKAAVRCYIPSYERDVLRKHALGNFRDLVTATAQHPAMLFYLDNFQSVAPASGNSTAGLRGLVRNGDLSQEARRRIRETYGVSNAAIDRRLRELREDPRMQQQAPERRGLNENYARELMELHTLGVDGGYTQKDIVEVAKAFTGWTIADPRGARQAASLMIESSGRMEARRRPPALPAGVKSGEFYFNARWHDNGTKTILGQKINEGGMKDGLKVIDILARHPSTAKHIARKLAVKFVRDDPSEQLVGRIAEAFSRSNGDIRSTLRALFADKDFFAPENYRAKIKTPFELAVSSIRALGGDTFPSPAMLAMLNKLGEVPYGYQAPTGYPDTAEDWVNTGALLERLNFAVAVASNRIPGTRVDLGRFRSGEPLAVLDRAIAGILAGEVSDATRSTLKKQIEQPLPEVKAGETDDEEEIPNMRPAGQPGGMNMRVRLLEPSGDPAVFKIVSFVLGTPEFQRQ